MSNSKLLTNYQNIPWKQVKRIRDILSYHYFDLDTETIFEICKNDISKLLATTTKTIEDVSKK